MEDSNAMNLIYGIKDKPKFGQMLVFAFQQVLAILAATIAVPAIVGNGMSASAALFGAGAGTIIYILFTKKKSPVFLGSSFAFIGSMAAAFAGAASVEEITLGANAEIGNMAFYNNSCLKEIDFSNAKEIGDYAFYMVDKTLENQKKNYIYQFLNYKK